VVAAVSPTILARTQWSVAAAAVSELVDSVTRLVKFMSVATWSVRVASPPAAGTARVQRTIELVRGSPEATDCGYVRAGPASGIGGASGLALLPPHAARREGACTAPPVMTTVLRNSRRE